MLRLQREHAAVDRGLRIERQLHTQCGVGVIRGLEAENPARAAGEQRELWRERAQERGQHHGDELMRARTQGAERERSQDDVPIRFVVHVAIDEERRSGVAVVRGARRVSRWLGRGRCVNGAVGRVGEIRPRVHQVGDAGVLDRVAETRDA